MKRQIPTAITVAKMEIDTAYEEAVSEDRYKVIQVGFWWRIKIGEGEATYGKFHSRRAAEDMVSLIRREFLNGAFAVRSREAQLASLGRLIADGAKNQPQKNEA